MTTPDRKVVAMAVIKILDNGDVTASLSSCNGVTARKLDAGMSAVYRRLNELRAIERRKDMVQHRADVAKEAAEQAKTDEVNDNA